MKSENFALKALKSQLINFDSHTINHMYIKNSNQVIRVKNLCIFKNIKIKKNTILPKYKYSKSLFQDYLLNDDNNKNLTTALNNASTNF